MGVMRRSNGYSKMNKEDPQDIIHRRAQFLIYKVMDQADCRRKPSFLGMRLCRLKVKIGARLKKLRKCGGVYKQVVDGLKIWRRLFNNNKKKKKRGGGGTINATLPRPLFT
ncbi:hypothetical protein E1A91_A06G161200v1 [Gossypium mustelinum]|uniref:Uncharacterized protein n=1 Tax=Gossypium mustelinum TaxID=34275 RepID=A0A5D2YXK1_GOSMU|nr:hypothetical protein E1A91_A06G161200v1 [Gossypium mustelinum]